MRTTAGRFAAIVVAAMSAPAQAAAASDAPGDEAAAKDPVAKDPVAKDPVAKDPVAKDPVAGEAASSAPIDVPSATSVWGYLRPGFGFRIRPEALPKDRGEYGFFADVGLGVTAQPHKRWRAELLVELDTELLTAVTDVGLFDLEGDGAPDDVFTVSEPVPGIDIQEATVSFEPHDTVALTAGIARIPFTIAQQSSSSSLLFPNRPEPNAVFVSGADLGAFARAELFDGRVVPIVGAFNGDSLGLGVAGATARGVVATGRLDVNPFGSFPIGDGDYEQGPFRLGVGFGAMVRPAALFDERTGTEPKNVLDVRLAASLRMAISGVYFSAEYLRRQQTDDFSSRPEVADGAYAQLAWFFRALPWLGFEPLARVGFVATDQSFDPRLVGFTDAGVGILPAADADEPDLVRVTLQYLGERRFTEREEAHGAAASVLLRY